MIICNCEHENVGKRNGKQLLHCAIRWQILKHVNAVSRSFVLALTVSEILKFETFDIENVGQGHLV